MSYPPYPPQQGQNPQWPPQSPPQWGQPQPPHGHPHGHPGAPPPAWGPGHNPYAGHPGQPPYGQGPRFVGQMPQWQPGYRPASSGSSGVRVLLIVFGVLGLIMTTFVWMATAYFGYGAAAATGVPAALLGCMTVVGVMWGAKAGKKLIGSAITAAVLLGVFIGAGPTASTGFMRMSEKTQWEELTSVLESPDGDPSVDLFAWEASYADLGDLRRDGWEAQWMLARVRQAKGGRYIGEVRQILQEIDERPDAGFDEAQDEATAFLKEAYASAQEKLVAPAGSGADESLRTAFAVMLDDFAVQPEANLYVSFAQVTDLTPPPGDSEELAAIRREPDLLEAFPNGAPVIKPGEAFTGRFDARRRDMFVSNMSDAFRHVFDDELLHLVPLAGDDARKEKYVLEVEAKIERVPFYGTYYMSDDIGGRVTKGLTFEFIVHWTFKLVGPDGTVRYEAPETISQAAPDVGLGLDPAPQWAIYGALMDSAYYNYSRQVVADFGLQPPPERTIFPYGAMGV